MLIVKQIRDEKKKERKRKEAPWSLEWIAKHP
jgi:hypothetical protein